MKGFVVACNLIEGEKLARFRTVASAAGTVVAVGAAGVIVEGDLEGDHGVVHAGHFHADIRTVGEKVPAVFPEACRIVFPRYFHSPVVARGKGLIVFFQIGVDFFRDILCTLNAHHGHLHAVCANHRAVVAFNFVDGFLESDGDGIILVSLLSGAGDIGYNICAGIIGSILGSVSCLRSILGIFSLCPGGISVVGNR